MHFNLVHLIPHTKKDSVSECLFKVLFMLILKLNKGKENACISVSSSSPSTAWYCRGYSKMHFEHIDIITSLLENKWMSDLISSKSQKGEGWMSNFSLCLCQMNNSPLDNKPAKYSPLEE